MATASVGSRPDNLSSKVRLHASALLVALAIFIVVELVLELLFNGRIVIEEVARGLATWLLVAPAISYLYVRYTTRAIAPFTELVKRTEELEQTVAALAATGLVIVIRTSLAPELRIEWVNRAFEKLTGRYAESVIGERQSDLDAEYTRDIARRREKLAVPAAPLVGISTIGRADGSRLPIGYEVISLPVQGATYTFAIDRSTEVLLEERLARLSRSEGVLDETRAALAAIEAQASLALGGELDRELRADLEAIAEAARRAAALLS
jgi:PAS domain-containing protein